MFIYTANDIGGAIIVGLARIAILIYGLFWLGSQLKKWLEGKKDENRIH